MRLIVFFDLPTLTSKQRKAYRFFRKSLIKSGYIMLQESVYAKLSMNYGSCERDVDKLKSLKPKEGLVQCLVVTEKQFSGIINICGEIKHSEIDSTERLVML